MTCEVHTEESKMERGRYYAEFVRVGVGPEPQERVQGVLDAGVERGWRLVAVSGGLPGGGAILYWETQEAS